MQLLILQRRNTVTNMPAAFEFQVLELEEELCVFCSPHMRGFSEIRTT
jgi:hypothetical protein